MSPTQRTKNRSLLRDGDHQRVFTLFTDLNNVELLTSQDAKSLPPKSLNLREHLHVGIITVRRGHHTQTPSLHDLEETCRFLDGPLRRFLTLTLPQNFSALEAQTTSLRIEWSKSIILVEIVT